MGVGAQARHAAASQAAVGHDKGPVPSWDPARMTATVMAGPSAQVSHSHVLVCCVGTVVAFIL